MCGLEALAAGRPVVCTDRVGMAELGGGRAVTVTSGDPSSIAAGLRPHLVDPRHADGAGIEARALAATCSPDTFAAARTAEYERAISLAG
jgi:hypothetical protein